MIPLAARPGARRCLEVLTIDAKRERSLARAPHVPVVLSEREPGAHPVSPAPRPKRRRLTGWGGGFIRVSCGAPTEEPGMSVQDGTATATRAERAPAWTEEFVPYGISWLD
jgi:hypothetical protein